MNRIREMLKRIPLIHELGILILKILYKLKWREQKRCYGPKNKDKTFYIIRFANFNIGLGSILNSVAYEIDYALKKNWIPVVDLKNHANMYLEKEKIKRENAWEYFFEQPNNVGVEEAFQSRHVILGRYRSYGYVGMNDSENIQCLGDIMTSYVRLNDHMKDIILQEKKRLGLNHKEKRVLGVVCRGTDYVTERPSKHAIPFTAEETFDEIDKLPTKYDYIYLATEDNKIFEKFKRKYNDKLLYTKQTRFDRNSGLLSSYESKEASRRQRGEEYLTVMYMLSECTALMTPGVAAGLIALRINNNAYENVYLLDKGCYD